MNTRALECLIFGLLFVMGAPQNSLADKKEKSVRIGLVFPLSGSRASIGEDAKQGALLALDDLQKSGELTPNSLELVFEDSQGDATKGVAAYKKLILDGVRFIITQNSNVSLAVAPLVNRDKVIQLAITTTSEKFSTPADNTFRTNGPTAPEAKLMVQAIQNRFAPPSKVGMVVMQDEYPVTLEKYVSGDLIQLGFALESESFLPHEADFRSIITRLSTKGVKAILFLGYQTQAGNFVKQFRELGSPIKTVIVNTPVNNREFFEIAGSRANGILGTYPMPAMNHPAAVRFQDRFLKVPNLFSANAYDSVIIAQKAIAACNYQLHDDCLRKSLFAIKDYNGLSGKKSFDSTYGDMQDTYSLLEARDGRFVPSF